MATLRIIAVALAALLVTSRAAADATAGNSTDELRVERPSVAADTSATAAGGGWSGDEITRKPLALSVSRYRIGHKSEVIGWRASERWYFGRHRADGSNVGFVFQKHRNESVSIGHKGIRWQRRF